MDFTPEQLERIVVALEMAAVALEKLTETQEKPPPPNDDEPETVFKRVIGDKAVMVEFVKKNPEGYPRYRVPLVVKDRVVARVTRVVEVFPKIILADGRNNVYELVPGKLIDGKKVPEDLFVRVSEVI